MLVFVSVFVTNVVSCERVVDAVRGHCLWKQGRAIVIAFVNIVGICGRVVVVAVQGRCLWT